MWTPKPAHYAHAHIKRIDTSTAATLPGVQAVIIFFVHSKRPDAFVEAFESLVQREGVQYGALQQEGEDAGSQ